MLDAFADGEDVGIRRLHPVVDDDAAVDPDAGLVRELDVGPDSRRHDDQIGFEDRAVLERHAFDVPVADNCRRRSAQQDANAEVLHLAGEVAACVGIELPFHQRRHEVHDGDITALNLQAARCLEAEQSTADHNRSHARSGLLEQLPRVVERPEGEHPISFEPRDRRLERGTTGCQQQRVVLGHAPIVTGDGFHLGIDVDDADAQAKTDVVVLIPLEGIQGDLVGRPLAREHRRKEDAVVVDVRLITEHRDCELRRVLQNLLNAGHTRHAIANDDEPFHREGSTRTAHCFIVGFPGNRIERTLRCLVGIGFGPMKRHEDLAGRDCLGQSQLQAVDAPATRDDVDALRRLQPERASVARVHLEPRARRQALQDGYFACLGPRVPVLDGAPRIENEWKLCVRRLGEHLPPCGDELCAPLRGFEAAIRIQAPRLAGFGGAIRVWPLDAARGFDGLVGHR